MPEKIKVDIKEIYKILCPGCKVKLEKAMMEKISRQTVRKALGGKDNLDQE